MDLLDKYDLSQCKALSSICGAPLSTSDPHWLLASLPVSLGGTGIRSAAAHSAAALVASTIHTQDTVARILGNRNCRRDNSQALALLSDLTSDSPAPLPSPIKSTKE